MFFSHHTVEYLRCEVFDGKTLLMNVAENGDLESVILLLVIGADIEAKDNDGKVA